MKYLPFQPTLRPRHRLQKTIGCNFPPLGGIDGLVLEIVLAGMSIPEPRAAYLSPAHTRRIPGGRAFASEDYGSAGARKNGLRGAGPMRMMASFAPPVFRCLTLFFNKLHPNVNVRLL